MYENNNSLKGRQEHEAKKSICIALNNRKNFI